MKKFLTLLVTAIIAVSCCLGLVGCGHTHDFNSVVTDKGTCTAEGTVTKTCKTCNAVETVNTPALGHSYVNGKCVRCQADAPALTPVQNVKVGLICLHDENSTYDKNFIDAMKAACLAKGISEENLVIKTGIPEGAECKEEANKMVTAGCNVIFADSFGHEPYIKEAAKANPNVQFYHATGTQAHTSGLANFHDAFANIYQGRYLAGVAAGMKLAEMKDSGLIKEVNKDENGKIKVGYVGAFTYAEVISGFTSWFLGVQSVVPETVMMVQFTGSWYDEVGEKEAANTLMEKGCALISQHADSWGAPTACEQKSVPNVSYNGSTESQCPNTYIVSSRINWQPYFEYIIESAKNGVAVDTDWCGGIKADLLTGSVALNDLGARAPAQGTKEKIDEVAAKIISGELKVFDCSKFTVGGQHLTSYLADVDDWGDYVPETEAIKKDGETYYFAESEFRSAPYFDIQIDGITYLNAKF